MAIPTVLRGGAWIIYNIHFNTAYRRSTNAIVYRILSGCQFGITLANRTKKWMNVGDSLPLAIGTYLIDANSPPAPPAPQAKGGYHPPPRPPVGLQYGLYVCKVNREGEIPTIQTPFGDAPETFDEIPLDQTGDVNILFSIDYVCAYVIKIG